MQASRRTVFLLLLCAAVVVGLFWWNRIAEETTRIQAHTREVTPRGSLADIEQTTISIFNGAAPSVVYIFTENAVAGFFGASQVRQGTGSGFLWDERGHVVTNYHVIEGARRIQVRLDNGEAIDAAYVGGTPDYDLAVIRLRRQPSEIQPIPVGTSGNLQVGQSVLAIGNPFGLARTLTTGVMSALNRRLPTATGREVAGVIQTDAAINPGNSGGALIDANGELIGINTAIYSKSGGSHGIGFAIPVEIAMDVLDEMLDSGQVVRGWIGITGRAVNPQTRQAFGLRAESGVMVSGVLPDGPADIAGLGAGDVITHIDNRALGDEQDLMRSIAKAGPGTPLKVSVLRGSQRLELSVLTSERPNLKD